jgi:hypothetical protein
MIYIKVKYEIEGIHRWKDCPFEDVSYLRDYHRHVFCFDVKMEVFQEDRDIEFIRLKKDLETYTKELLDKPVDLSCEAMARLVLEYCQETYGNRHYDIYVSEDNENGGGIEI